MRNNIMLLKANLNKDKRVNLKNRKIHSVLGRHTYWHCTESGK